MAALEAEAYAPLIVDADAPLPDSAARISARSDKSGEALRATRRSGARNATERCHQPPGHKPKTGIKQALFPVGWMSLLALFIPFLLMQLQYDFSHLLLEQLHLQSECLYPDKVRLFVL